MMAEWLLRPKAEGPKTSMPGLPLVLQQSLPRRLSLAALTYAAVFLLMLIVNLLEVWLDPATVREDSGFYVTTSVCILGGLAVSVWARRSGASTRSLHFVGLAFQIAGTFGIALASIDFPLPGPDPEGYVGIPWTCPWILAYPLMVPSRPRYAAAAGVLATFACLAAVKFRLLVLEPMAPDPALQIWFYLMFMNLVCAAWGMVGSLILQNLGRQVAEARRLGSYHLEELLGRGGMGEVWKARHRLLARTAAVKIIRAEALGDAADSQLAAQRFEREAQATAALQSPHSVGLYDYGISEDGTFYYVMELLDGMDLDSLVRQFGPVESERVIHWLRHACHSLAEAHHNGLIHRDIKPANLYACRFGLEWDFLKVLDFGLVKPTGLSGNAAPALTAEHTVAGTAAYMSPEIASGDHDVGARSDIYALGCVAYWLLTGQLVFRAETPLKMIMQHVQAEPVAPSLSSELDIAPDLDRIVLDCLEKNPDARPHSAIELSERLAHCTHADDWTPVRAQRWWEAHRPTRPDAGETQPTESRRG